MAGHPGLIPGLGRFSGEGTNNPLQYSCLENPTDRGAWRATVHELTRNQTQVSKQAHTLNCKLLGKMDAHTLLYVPFFQGLQAVSAQYVITKLN